MRTLMLVALCGGCGVLPDPTAHGQRTLTLDAFTVMPGEERYVCQDFANPYGGGDTAITRFTSHLSAGAHHLIVFYKAGAENGKLEDCSGNEFAAGPYGSQRLDDEMKYPSGVGAVIPAGDGLRIQAHYLNATQAPLQASVRLEMEGSAASLVQPAAVLFMSNLDVQVPAGASGVAQTKTCKLPYDVKILQTSGHMHRHGTSFTAEAGGKTLFQSSAWIDVMPSFFDPPVELSAGTDVTWTCTYDNPGPTALVYGDSAQTDEMCIFSAQFYPAPVGGWSCF